MNDTDTLKLLVKELGAALEASKFHAAWDVLEKLKVISDAPNQEIKTEVFGAMPPELRMMAFDSFIGNMAKIVRHAKITGQIPSEETLNHLT